MKKLLLICGMLWSAVASAQFTPGQVLTAAELNSQFALYAPLTGASFSGLLSAIGITTTPISGSTGSFTNLSASGTVSFPAGTIPPGSLSVQAANTILANSTGASASPAANSAPSCSTSSSALQWVSGAGLACNSAVNAATLGGATFASPGAIGGTTASPANFSTLNVSTTISGAGFSTYLSSPPSIGNITPGAVSSSSGALNGTLGGSVPNAANFTTIHASSTITPSTTSGIVGTTLADNAQAGSVGEYLTVTGTATSVTSGNTAATTSLSLTAGDWDVEAVQLLTPAGTTQIQDAYAAVSTNSTNLGATGAYQQAVGSATTGIGLAIASPVVRVNVPATTTVYATVNVAFTVSTCTATGFLRARRVR